jgi:hypothetical protein
MMRNYLKYQIEEIKDEKELRKTSLMKKEDNVLKELKVRVFKLIKTNIVFLPLF